MSDVERLRLFVAARPPETHVAWLDDALDDLRNRLASARWIAVDNQHLTLKFLGTTPSDRLAAVMRVVELVARGRDASDVSFTQLGAFPSTRRARVLWIGLDDPRSLLANLASDLNRSFQPLGYPVEDRAFTPHLTLARFKVPARVEGLLPHVATDDLDPWRVEKVTLFRSRLHPKGARYEELQSFELGGAPSLAGG